MAKSRIKFFEAQYFLASRFAEKVWTDSAVDGNTFAVPGTHAAAKLRNAPPPPRCLFIRGKTVRRFLRGPSVRPTATVRRHRTDRVCLGIGGYVVSSLSEEEWLSLSQFRACGNHSEEVWATRISLSVNCECEMR